MRSASVAEAAGKKIAMDVSNGWYIYAFFQGAGYELTLNDDGSNNCTWNATGATDVLLQILLSELLHWSGTLQVT